MFDISLNIQWILSYIGSMNPCIYWVHESLHILDFLDPYIFWIHLSLYIGSMRSKIYWIHLYPFIYRIPDSIFIYIYWIHRTKCKWDLKIKVYSPKTWLNKTSILRKQNVSIISKNEVNNMIINIFKPIFFLDNWETVERGWI